MDLAVWLQWLLFAALALVLDGDVPARESMKSCAAPCRGVKSGPAGDTLTLPAVLPPGETCRVEYRGCSWSAINGGNTVIAAGSRAHIDRVDGLP